MSAPDTDIEKQTKRHRGPLRGMFAVVLFALVMLAILTFWAFGRGGDPEGAVQQVQEGIGVTEPAGADDAITANDSAEEEQGVGTQATTGVADPTAVTVPSLQVEAPQSGMATDAEQNPIVGGSDAAVPLDPVEGEGGESVAIEGGQGD